MWFPHVIRMIKPCASPSLNSMRLFHLADIYRTTYSFYDPPYLKSMIPEIPEYDTLNVQMKGYDFALLESYQKLVNRIANSMDIEVENGWATPSIQTKVQRYKTQSTVVESEDVLCTYERNIQIVDVPTTKLPILLELLQTALPQGVNISVHEHLEEYEAARYVPDLQLKDLKTQLETLGRPYTEVKKK